MLPKIAVDVFKAFLSKDRPDNFLIEENNIKKYKFRGSFDKTKKNQREILYTKPKKMNGFTKISLEDPFSLDIYKDYAKNKLQKNIDLYADKMICFGTLAFSCSCGGGKTLAGIILMAKLKLQTLIISTRCAINDQWRDTLLKTYGENINVLTQEGLFTVKNKRLKIYKFKEAVKAKIVPDVYVYSAQYLCADIERFPLSVGLVIYDEIHSQTSNDFGRVLLRPFQNVINGKNKELPYFLGLSATYPLENTPEYNLIIKIFGVILKNSSTIKNIPVKYFDIRDVLRDSKDEFDEKYHPMDDYEFIDNVLKHNIKFYNKTIEPIILNENGVSGYVITSTIDSSVYTWLSFHEMYKDKKCVLIRENHKGCYVLTGEIPEDIKKLGKRISLQDIIHCVLFKNFCKKVESFNGYDIVFGTYHRLKEGINIPNAVWGICTKFVWGMATRIQILGRIRRNTTDDKINNHDRYFLVSSPKIPSNIYYVKHHKPWTKPTLRYNLTKEEDLFKDENYIKIFLEND